MKNLIKQCKHYNRHAQREMVEHLTPFLSKIIYRYTLNYPDTQDYLQEVLILILNKIKSFSSTDEVKFYAWCKRVCINYAISQKRKQKTIVPLDFVEAKAAPESPLQDLYKDELLNIVSQIPETYRNVFNLIVVDGYSHKEVAEILQIKESSSRAYLVRARHAIQELLNIQEIK